MAKGVLGLGGFLLPANASSDSALDSYNGAWKGTYDDGQMTRRHVLREAIEPDIYLRAKRRVYDARIAGDAPWNTAPADRLAVRERAYALPHLAESRYRNTDGTKLSDYVPLPA